LKRSYSIQKNDLVASYEQNRILNEENEKLSGSNDTLKGTIASLERQQSNLQESINQAKSDLEAAQNEIMRVLRDIDAKNTELATANANLEAATSRLQVNLGNSRTQPMIFRYGEELARMPLPAGMLPAEALSNLRRLLLNASIAADERGAKPTPITSLSAGLFTRTEGGRTVSIEEQEQLISQAIANQKDEIVLIAYSTLNAFQGEYVALTIKPYRNPVVFKANETIAEGRIDGSQSETTVLTALTHFIEENVTDAALKKGMIPRQSMDGPFGKVSSEKILALVKMISEFGRTVRITAYATDQTRAADILRLDFKLR
jgi:hypothetical protein